MRNSGQASPTCLCFRSQTAVSSVRWPKATHDSHLSFPRVSSPINRLTSTRWTTLWTIGGPLLFAETGVVWITHVVHFTVLNQHSERRAQHYECKFQLWELNWHWHIYCTQWIKTRASHQLFFPMLHSNPHTPKLSKKQNKKTPPLASSRNCTCAEQAAESVYILWDMSNQTPSDKCFMRYSTNISISDHDLGWDSCGLNRFLKNCLHLSHSDYNTNMCWQLFNSYA